MIGEQLWPFVIPFNWNNWKNYSIRKLTEKPIVLLEGVEETPRALRKVQNLLWQPGRSFRQGEKTAFWIGKIFSTILEVMSDKTRGDYSDLIKRLEIKPGSFMIGNSLKSTLFCQFWPLEGHAVHIPFIHGLMVSTR
jgi:putative hydrolase of the HAD superfamily